MSIIRKNCTGQRKDISRRFQRFESKYAQIYNMLQDMLIVLYIEVLSATVQDPMQATFYLLSLALKPFQSKRKSIFYY